MAWRIDFTRNADKAMRKLDKGVAARVFDELDEIAKLEDPKPVLRKPRGLLGRGMRTVTIDRRSGRGVRAARNENARPALSQAGGSFV